jgi:hypothetical protein
LNVVLEFVDFESYLVCTLISFGHLTLSMTIYFKYQNLCLKLWSDQICGREVHWIMGESKCIFNLHWTWMLELEIKSKSQFLSSINIIMVVSILQHFCSSMHIIIHYSSKFPTFPYGVNCIHDYTQCIIH